MKKIIFILLIGFIPFPFYTFNLQSEKLLIYDHFNKEKNQVTGYTIYSLKNRPNKKAPIELKKIFVRTNGENFLTTIIFFDNDYNILSSYSEHFSDQEKLQVQYQKNRVIVYKSIKNKKEKKEIVQKEEYVSYEQIELFLENNYMNLKQKNTFVFNFFLPSLMFELDQYNLSNLSTITLKGKFIDNATIIQNDKKKKASKLIIRPESSFIRFLLPKEKSEFIFYFSKEGGNQIIQMHEGKMIYSLISEYPKILNQYINQEE